MSDMIPMVFMAPLYVGNNSQSRPCILQKSFGVFLCGQSTAWEVQHACLAGVTSRVLLYELSVELVLHCAFLCVTPVLVSSDTVFATYRLRVILG